MNLKNIKNYILLMVAVFFIIAGSVALAQRSAGQTAVTWVTDPKTGCQIGLVVSDSVTIVAAIKTGKNGRARVKLR